MNRNSGIVLRVVLVLVLVAVGASQARAQDGNTEGWKSTAELSYVLTSGNSESSTLGFKGTTERAWVKSSFRIELAGIRAENTTRTFNWDGTTLEELETTELSAENYFFRGRYDRKISERFFWFVGAAWERNRFAGYDNRYTGQAGVGNIWVDNDKTKFTTDYAISYTDREDIVPDPTREDSFAGYRLSWYFRIKFGKSDAEYVNEFGFNGNADEGSDWRAVMDQSITMTMTDMLALKIGLLLSYFNEPALAISGFTAPATAGIPVQLDELDTVFTTSLVFNF